MRQTGIYQIRNVINGKAYVGSALHIRRRWRQHRWLLMRGIHHSMRLQGAWNKYGQGAFVFEIIETVENSVDLVQREQYFIDSLGVFAKGYNCRPTADNQSGRVVGKETREKLSRAALGRKQSPETIAARAASNRGNHHPPRSAEFRAKQSAARKGKRLSAETRKAMSLARTGMTFSPERCANISAALKGRKLSVAARKAMSAALIGRRHSEETKAKMSASQKLRRARHAQ